ncbi:MAG TPA: diguanylate cyclase [Polyangiaceae bacterium]|nr:diguanylate cyclase [Polyangiaceae bacterium]
MNSAISLSPEERSLVPRSQKDGPAPKPVCCVAVKGAGPSLAAELATELARTGRAVVEVEAAEVGDLCGGPDAPAVVVVDVDGFEPAHLEAIAGARPDSVPLVFVGGTAHDVSPRLIAVRVGATAYFGKPVNVASLVEKLEHLAAERSPQPYRVLVVDDDPLLARLYARALEHAGMIAATARDPLKVLAQIDDFQPDLILMDYRMPGVSGPELSAVIRLEPSRFSIPIVFLSTEDLRDNRRTALKGGGDDFLVKPIPLEQLVAEVAIRAERARTVSSFMLKDALTGLYNHATLMQLLEVEVARSARANRPMAFSMIDVDFFKKVNDTHGHPAGDRVLRALSRHLQNRLRRTDVIGRYGGEEFAVVLSDVDAENAVRVVDHIRVGFGAKTHQSEKGDFKVTLSMGVATFPAIGEPHRLVEAADQALYAAKHGGRNRVVVTGR